MPIWVDADACPGEIKELLFRAAKRTKTKVTLVANHRGVRPRQEVRSLSADRIAARVRAGLTGRAACRTLSQFDFCHFLAVPKGGL